jgi:hypothetical protein
MIPCLIRSDGRHCSPAALEGAYRIEASSSGAAWPRSTSRDRKHDRDVAINTFYTDPARSRLAERFLLEIAITVRLNHPHILASLEMRRNAKVHLQGNQIGARGEAAHNP